MEQMRAVDAVDSHNSNNSSGSHKRRKASSLMKNSITTNKRKCVRFEREDKRLY
jgi:hypothetical protein